MKPKWYAAVALVFLCAVALFSQSRTVATLTYDAVNNQFHMIANGIDTAVSGATPAFSAVTAGTNATALVVGTGGSLAASGSGTIDATTLLTKTWAAPAAIGTGTPAAATFTAITGTSINTTNLLVSSTAPTITTHFNTSGDSISASNGTAAFQVTVGTGAGNNTGTVGLPTATTGWVCNIYNMTRAAVVRQTASSTASATFVNYGTSAATPANWTNSDVLAISCFAY